MIGITARFVLLVATAAVLPLLIFGVVALSSLGTATTRSVIAGNLNIATRAAEQIDLYVSTTVKILRTVAADLQGTRLQAWQQDRILRNYVLQFPEFREVTLFDSAGHPLASSRLGTPRTRMPSAAATVLDDLYLEPIMVDDDLLPTTTAAVKVSTFGQADAWLTGEFDLVELWRMVDRIRVGERGFALLVAGDGRLVAHGDPDQKRRVARGENLLQHPLVHRIRTQRSAVPVTEEVPGDQGEALLAVAAPIERLGWTVIVEQPTSEAYAVADRLSVQLWVAIAVALLITMYVGYLWSRGLIRPIQGLMGATRALAAGQLSARVEVAGTDELAQLGRDFNGMADRLVELQDDVRRQERQAMFGRIAAGLAHDLAHPIQNIGNSCRLILRMSDDAEYRETFSRTVQREMAAVRSLVEDLRNLARPMSLERFPIDLNKAVADVIEAMRSNAEIAGVTLEAALSPEPLQIEGDLFGLGRVQRNLIVNAIQATAPGGTITVATERRDHRAVIRVSDTGCGIPPDRLTAIFDDFTTTKRRGLGLGLAICKKIVD